MTTFTPTKEELEELGFIWGLFGNINYFSLKVNEDTIQYFTSLGWYIYGDDSITLYPQSIDDIRTLIKLLTPNE